MKKLTALLLVVILALGMLASCETSDPSKKSEGVLTYAEYVAAELETEVVIEAYIQAVQAYNEQYGNTSLYLADPDGGYFVYRYACTAEEYAKLTRGTKVKVTGTKTEWGGWVEIAEGTAKVEVIDEPHWVWSALDVTDKIGTDELLDNQNRLCAFKGMEIVSISPKGGSFGDDIYVTAKLGENQIDFCVEADLTNAESDLYKMFTAESGALKVGDVVDIEGYLVVYQNAANPHVTKIVKK
ncbi:MAG: hypothetical protein IKC32_02665 [Clostridia bacterium]|nr:hypothetical protein [Clostridia bacterium]